VALPLGSPAGRGKSLVDACQLSLDLSYPLSGRVDLHLVGIGGLDHCHGALRSGPHLVRGGLKRVQVLGQLLEIRHLFSP
jgi:hypothetical protein